MTSPRPDEPTEPTEPTEPSTPKEPSTPPEQPQYPQYPPPPPLPPENAPNYGAGGYDYGYGAPPVQPRNGMGIAALVMGIVGFLIGPASILAITFGRIGLNRAARGEATNRGVAQAGFVLGLVTLALWILGLILVATRS